ncbi:hypothetical protein PMZ80_002130 [Knufia obscura]|uniref:Cytochrome P450 n=2 Tax=Knufia TaxID=430999 RepID=A0AAN8I4D1_9EURO|nr:hypothetical protein PMZ80_002130 [Knufia obscura]KAK5953942.1 hypothetical protein OHC33_005213 [Knufia fluminis]
MANNIIANISVPGILAVAAVLLLIKRVYWELTVGANRRRLIKENGCKPVKKYAHKGVLGKLFGYDTMKQSFQAAKQGRLHEMSRLRNFDQQTTIQIRNLNRDFILTIEPENVKAVLSTKFNDFGLGGLRVKTMGPVFGTGIFTSDGKSWEHSRAMIRPNFTRQQVGDLSIYEDHVQHLLTHIPKNGQTVNLQDLFFKLTMDSATEFLFGKSTNMLKKGQEHPDGDRFSDAFTYVTECMAMDFRTAQLNRLLSDPKRKDDSEFIRKFATDIIDDAIANRKDIEKGAGEKQNYIFLYELLKVTNDPYTLRSELLNVLLAGRDTTASLLSHTFHQLARRPDVWAKLQAEVDELGGQTPSYEAMKSMKYVKWVINESLRLWPVVPGNNRISVRDTVLPVGGGPDGKSPMFVPKGTPVGYSVWSMHRRKDFFGEDALEFKPERWETLRPGWEYLPFNGGPRICIGQNFALTEASYVMIRLLQNFRRIEPRDDKPWSEFQTLTLAVGNGVHVGLYQE